MIICAVGIVLTSLETLPLLAIALILAGLGLILTSRKKNQEGQETQKTQKLLVGECDPLILDQAFLILDISQEEKGNRPLIDEKYRKLRDTLQTKINSGKLPPCSVEKIQHIICGVDTAYRTITRAHTQSNALPI